MTFTAFQFFKAQSFSHNSYYTLICLTMCTLQAINICSFRVMHYCVVVCAYKAINLCTWWCKSVFLLLHVHSFTDILLFHLSYSFSSFLGFLSYLFYQFGTLSIKVK